MRARKVALLTATFILALCGLCAVAAMIGDFFRKPAPVSTTVRYNSRCQYCGHEFWMDPDLLTIWGMVSFRCDHCRAPIDSYTSGQAYIMNRAEQREAERSTGGAQPAP
jgi:hypothetical protein